MSIVFKKSRGRYYLQLIDSLGFIHYVGVVNLENLAACAHNLGFIELFAWREKIRKRLAGKGFENLYEAANVYQQAYNDGRKGLAIWEIKGLDTQKYKEKCTYLENRIMILEMLYKRLREVNEILSNDIIRRGIQAQVRNSSQEAWRQWRTELNNEY